MGEKFFFNFKKIILVFYQPSSPFDYLVKKHNFKKPDIYLECF
jgi:hypothetical protein